MGNKKTLALVNAELGSRCFCSVKMKIKSKNSFLIDRRGKLFNYITSHGSESIMTELLWHFSLHNYLITNSPCMMCDVA